VKCVLRCIAATAMLSLACSSFGISDEQPAKAKPANVCVDGAYVGPEPGTRLAAGSRDDECLGVTATEDMPASLTAVTKNGCHWRLTLLESGQTLDEGECVTALANEAADRSTLGLYSTGSVWLASESRFALTAHIGNRWCELEDGLVLSDTEPAPALEWFIVTADYTEPSGGVVNKEDTTLFGCVLFHTGKEPGTTQARLEVDSLSPVCWQTDTYYYRVHGSAEFECEGQVAGNAQSVHIEVSF
jgi:hypothetical protein